MKQYNEIRVQRFKLTAHSTLSRVFVNDKFFCYGLEPVMLEMKSDENKPYAVPCGRYMITLDIVSPKYCSRVAYRWIRAKLPRVLNVPGFQGILIHIGNTYKDTAGCLLVGESYYTKAGEPVLFNSSLAFTRLYQKLKSFTSPICIKYEISS